MSSSHPPKIRRIVVTGGAGFIGSHVVELLCNQKFNVYVVDDLRFGYKKFVDSRAKFFQVAIEDTKNIEKILKGVDAVIHLAASSIIQYSYLRPLEYFENNLINSVKLLEAMRRKGVRKIIFSSSSSVYGEPLKIPTPEDAPTYPLNAYAASKLAFEEALIAYYHAYGVESVTLRYYNAYGPRDEQRPRTRAIPMWMEAIVRKEPVPWYWQGKQIRDYVYVTDIAQAHLDVLSLSGLHCFNLGSGKGVHMRSILHKLEKIVGKKLKTLDLGERQGDPMKSYADISRIKKAVGWFPRISLEEGLRNTYQYYQQARDL